MSTELLDKTEQAEKIEKVTLPLTCKLTDQEVLDASAKLADALNRYGNIERGLESAKAHAKAELQECEKDIEHQKHLIETKEEKRSIECEVRYDWAAGTKTTVRMDTGDKVREEKITDQERQIEAQFTEKEPEPEAAPFPAQAKDEKKTSKKK